MSMIHSNTLMLRSTCSHGLLFFLQDLDVELQKEKQTLETHVDELKKRVAELTERIQALKERERLLVAFPELNSWPQDQPQSM